LGFSGGVPRASPQFPHDSHLAIFNHLLFCACCATEKKVPSRLRMVAFPVAVAWHAFRKLNFHQMCAFMLRWNEVSS
jgi:hypothetical protein